MKTKNLAVGILAAVLVTALWWTMLLKPTRAKASKAHANTANEQSQLQSSQAQLATAQGEAAHASEFKAQLASLELAMPDSPALAAFIRDANNIAQAAGVSWQSVTHAPPAQAGVGEMSITIGIQIKGTYAQVMDYLGRLAALQRLVVVDTVQFSSAGTSGATTGTSASSGGSTGPFSGGTALTAVISARMFETGTLADGTDATTESAPAPAASTPAATPAQTSTLNNS